jgi:uncharacterized protein YndB with AHSA1/START domain
MKNRTTVERKSDRELVVTRTFNAPARIVFEAWTRPELLKRWWAPKSFGVTLFECESELRPGGKFRYAFGRDPKNPEVFSGQYKEVDAPSRLVLTQTYERFRDAGEAVVTVTFQEHDGKTRLTLHQVYPSREALDRAIASGMEHGMRETFDQLDGLVSSIAGSGNEPAPMKNRTTVERKSERELVVTRTFNAPARIVFEAWTRPELLKRWWAPKSTGVSLLSCEADVRVGGSYRFEFRHGASKPMAFFGRYIEVIPHSRLVWTNDESDDGAVTTLTFEEKAGKTLLVMHELYPSKEALDRTLAGMEDSMPETFEQLDELLVTLSRSVGRA